MINDTRVAAMKLTTILVFALFLSACTEDERPKVQGISVLQPHHVGLVCFEDVKYLVYSGGIAAKIDSETRLPERCTE